MVMVNILSVKSVGLLGLCAAVLLLNACTNKEVENADKIEQQPPQTDVTSLDAEQQWGFSDLDGVWKGTLQEKHFVNSIVMEIRGDYFTFQGIGQTLLKGNFVIDEDKTPAYFDVKWNTGIEVKAIIERTGENSLRIENNLAGRDRPTAFGPKVMEFKRERE